MEPSYVRLRLMGMSKMWALAVGAVAGQLVIVGCGNSSGDPGGEVRPNSSRGTVTTSVEQSPEPTPLRSFPYTLYTHCGIRFASFDGRVWATAPLSDGNGNPPAGWGNPGQAGWVDIMSERSAVFTASGLPPLTFHPTNEPLPLCS